MAFTGCVPIYDVQAINAVGTNYMQLVGAGVYTGPYEVVGLNDQRITLDRNGEYWRGTPAMGGVVMDFVTDPLASVLAIQNGEVDLAFFMPPLVKPVVDRTPGIFFNHQTPHLTSVAQYPCRTVQRSTRAPRAGQGARLPEHR